MCNINSLVVLACMEEINFIKIKILGQNKQKVDIGILHIKYILQYTKIK